MEISKSDWKLFRACIAEWQENYMERLVKENIDMLNGNGNASDKFWELEERIKKDKKHPGVMLHQNVETAWIRLFICCLDHSGTDLQPWKEHRSRE